MIKYNRWFLAILLFISLLLACRLGPSRPRETPTSPLQTVAPAQPSATVPPPAEVVAPTPAPSPTPSLPQSQEIVPDEQRSQRAKQNFNQALQEASGQQPFQFRITDQEATSLMALELAQQAEFPLSEPQIRFSNSQVHLSGNVPGLGSTTVPALIVATPLINSNGQLEIRIDEAKMGNFTLPKAFVDSLTQTANESLADLSLDVQIQNIEILEGELIVTGTRPSP